MMKFCTEHHKTHTDRGKKLQIASSNSKDTFVVNHRHVELWNTMKNCAAYIECRTKSFHLRTVTYGTDHHKTHTIRGEKTKAAS
jgi:hypothetical protein